MTPARNLLSGLLLLMAMACLASCNGPRYSQSNGDDVAASAFAVRVESPRGAGDVDFRAPLSGTVQSGGQVQLGFQVSGKVSEVLVEEGDLVREGQVLARLDSRIYAAQLEQALGAGRQAEASLEMLENGSRPQEILAAQAGVDSANAVLERLERDFQRTRLLYDQGVVSRSELDAAESGLKQARESVVSARQQLELAQEGPRTEQLEQARGALATSRGSIELARTQLEYSQLRAPMDGTVVHRALEPGQVVAAGSPVLEIADLASLEVRTEVPEGDLSGIAPGDTARISFPARPDVVAAGSVLTVAPKAGMTTRAFPVTISLDDVPDTVVPGMVALVTLGFAENPGGLVIRENSMIDGAVFVVRGDRAARVPVEVIADRGGLVFVDGLSPGDKVVVNGQHRISDGDAVRIVDALGVSEITRLENNGG